MTKNEIIQVLQSIEDRAVDFPYMTACDWVAIAAAKRQLSPNNVWHDITEEPQYNQNGRTDFIVDSYYGHIGREAHTYDSEQWSAHLGFVENMEFRWAYEKDLIDFD